MAEPAQGIFAGGVEAALLLAVLMCRVRRRHPSGDASIAHEKAFRDAEVDGVLRPADVAWVRKVLGLSQRKAGQVLGGGPRAFQKYEAGT